MERLVGMMVMLVSTKERLGCSLDWLESTMVKLVSTMEILVNRSEMIMCRMEILECKKELTNRLMTIEEMLVTTEMLANTSVTLGQMLANTSVTFRSILANASVTLGHAHEREMFVDGLVKTIHVVTSSCCAKNQLQSFKLETWWSHLRMIRCY